MSQAWDAAVGKVGDEARSKPRPEKRGARLARELCVVYLLLIIYATLHPITSWRVASTSPFAWLTHWPRTTLPFDVGFNIAAYVPLGALLVWALYPALRSVGAVLVAALSGSLLSLVLESLQTYLPSRTSSLMDLAANAAGASAGAVLAALLTRPLFESGRVWRPTEPWVAAGRGPTRALILASLWMFALLFPESLLFGHGNVIAYFDAPVSGYPFTPSEFARVETAVTAASLFAAGSVLLSAFTPGAPRLQLLGLFLFVACGLRTLSQVILFGPDTPWAWLTPGATRGLLAGGLALCASLPLTRAMHLALLMIAVTFATVVVNIAPPNPYYMAIVAELNPGRFLDFNGLTQLVSAMWPFLALFYAVFALAEGERH